MSAVKRETANASRGSLVPGGDLPLLAVEEGWTPDMGMGGVWK